MRSMTNLERGPGALSIGYAMSRHAQERLQQRGISEEEVRRAMASPFVLRTGRAMCREVHAPVRAGNRWVWLTVILAPLPEAPKVVTVFFRGDHVSSDQQGARLACA